MKLKSSVRTGLWAMGSATTNSPMFRVGYLLAYSPNFWNFWGTFVRPNSPNIWGKSDPTL